MVRTPAKNSTIGGAGRCTVCPGIIARLRPIFLGEVSRKADYDYDTRTASRRRLRDMLGYYRA